jgi:tRNA(fMet)-specific endonuclease VapC
VSHYLLDTNIVSDIVRNPQGTVARKIAAVGEADIVTSIVVAAELRFGAEKKRSSKLSAQLQAVLDVLPVLPLSDGADAHYGVLRAQLERDGTPIGGNDMLIAAHALAMDCILVTDNAREFERVNGLQVENWLR